MDIKREHEKLIEKANKLPGVAELMAVYKRLEKIYQSSRKFTQETPPEVIITCSDTSTTQPLIPS